LRICENDDDFFKLTLNEKDPRIHLGVALTAFPENPDDPYLSNIQIDHLSDTGDQILHAGQQPEEATPDAIPLRAVVVTNTLQATTALVRVRGESDFYHLVQLNPSAPPEGPQQDSPEQEQNEDSENEGGENEQEKEEEDQPSKDEENQQEEDKPSENAEEKEEKQEPKPEEEQPAQEAQPRDVSEDPEMQRIDDILEALENSDHNFQMKKALENVPNRYIERDW
jgi:DNA polymerase sigma